MTRRWRSVRCADGRVGTRSHGQRIDSDSESQIFGPSEPVTRDLRHLEAPFRSVALPLALQRFFPFVLPPRHQLPNAIPRPFHPPSIVLRPSRRENRETLSCPLSLSLSFLLDSGLHFSMLTKLRGTRSPWPGRDRLECLFEASTMRVLLRCTHEIRFFFFFFFFSSSASFRFVHLIRFFLPLEPAVVVQYYRRLVPRRRFLTCANTRICFSIGARAGKTTLSPLCFRSSGQFKHRIAGSPFALLWVNDYRARMEARRDSFARHDCDCVWTVCATWKFKCEER